MKERKDILKSSRKLRRKRFFLKILFLFVLFLAVCAGLVWALYIPYLRIQKISVEGAEILSVEKIISNVSDSIKGKYFFVIPQNNILIASKKDIIDNLLSSFPRIKEISLDKNFLNILSVKIREWKQEALFCRGETKEECFYVGEDGYIFEKAPYFSGDIYLKIFDERGGDLEIGRNIISADQFKGLIGFRNFLSRENIKIISILLKKEGVYELKTEEEWIILLNERNDSRLAFENLRTALDSSIKENRKNLDYIDLRFGNKVFYKFK